MAHRAAHHSRLHDLCTRIGRRGAYLLVLAVVDILYGVSILTEASIQFAKHYLLLPPDLWGWVFVGTGVVMAFQAFARVDRIGYSLAVILKFAWATVALYDYLLLSYDIRGWQTAVLWYGLGIMTAIVANWPEYTTPDLDAYDGEDA